jgi:crotonyl-CoA reductase
MTLSGPAIENASPEELATMPLPDTYRAAYVSRDDVAIFKDSTDKDVRRSLRVGEVPLVELAPDEALIAVMASSINYNTIWSAIFEPIPTFYFLYQFAQAGGWYTRHDQPYHVLGSDAAGIVLRVGDAVSRWSPGDRVVVYPGWVDLEDPIIQVDGALGKANRAWGFETNFGGLARLAVVKGTQLMPKPKQLTWEEAACNSLCAMTAYRMLVSPRAAQFKQGDIVLIWGATGGLGSYAVQYVRNGGGFSVGVVSSDRKADLLEQLGCDLVIRRDRIEAGLTGVDLGKAVGRQIRETFGEDPHIVFEHVGQQTFDASVYLVRTGGAVVTCGSSSGYAHHFDNRHLWMRFKRIVGSHGANYQEAFEANRLIAHGRIIPALSRVFTLDEVADATREVQLNRHVGKVGILCLAEKEGLGIEDAERRAATGEERLRLFRQYA